jgi:LuxR family transcriptional regulator, maltose regulon positive regulatory protein
MIKKEELLTTKLYIPPCRPGLVDRPRLKERLDAGMNSGCVLVSAPAGFGKTSLVRGWLGGFRGKTIWISLDKGDNDPARFLRYLLAGLDAAGAGIGGRASSLISLSQDGLPEIEPLLTLVVNELTAAKEDIIFILDDYHVIENKDIHNAVLFLIENTPVHVHVVISTRNDPPLPLPRWRVRGQITEVRGDDLRFTLEEIKLLLQGKLGQALSDTDISALGDKTEGWAAGLQMALLSLQGRQDPADFIRNFSGSHRYVMDYLIEEVLRRQPEETQSFLLRTSILERMNGDLCDAVTGQTGGRSQLEEMEKDNLFLVSLDDGRCWYRYHHLFADLLRARLKEFGPGLTADLHRRAAQWYEENGILAEAITHSCAAADHQRTAALLEKTILPMLTRGELTTLLRWSRQLPENVISSRPYLCVSLAMMYVFTGETQEIGALLNEAERHLSASDDSVVTRDTLGSIAALRAFTADMKGNTAYAIEQAVKAEKMLSVGNHLMRTALPMVLARAYRLDGKMDEAIGQLQKLAGLAQAAGNVMTLAVANYEIAATWKLEGRLRRAGEIYRDTLQLAEEKGARNFGSIAKIDAGMSELLLEWNDVAGAVKLSTGAIERMRSWKNPTDLVIAFIMLLRVRRSTGDLINAAEALQKAENLARTSPVFPPLSTMLNAERVKLWLAQNNLAAAAQWAEEYVLDEERPVIVRELEQLTLAEVLLKLGKHTQSLDLLMPLEAAAAKDGRSGRLIQILIIQALVYKSLNNDIEALIALSKALRLAEPEGYLRSFIDVGTPMSELLFALKNRQSKGQDGIAVSKEYLNKIFAGFTTGASSQSGLAENLSERELEILRLIARGMTNKDIAEELFITAGTVKAHTSNIFRKLDVLNRTQAITVAGELKLI